MEISLDLAIPDSNFHGSHMGPIYNKLAFVYVKTRHRPFQLALASVAFRLWAELIIKFQCRLYRPDEYKKRNEVYHAGAKWNTTG